jgi:hypothetical protein
MFAPKSAAPAASTVPGLFDTFVLEIYCIINKTPIIIIPNRRAIV